MISENWNTPYANWRLISYTELKLPLPCFSMMSLWAGLLINIQGRRHICRRHWVWPMLWPPRPFLLLPPALVIHVEAVPVRGNVPTIPDAVEEILLVLLLVEQWWRIEGRRRRQRCGLCADRLLLAEIVMAWCTRLAGFVCSLLASVPLVIGQHRQAKLQLAATTRGQDDGACEGLRDRFQDAGQVLREKKRERMWIKRHCCMPTSNTDPKYISSSFLGYNLCYKCSTNFDFNSLFVHNQINFYHKCVKT